MANNRSFFNGSNIYRAQTERLRREKLVDAAIACNLAGVKAL